MFLAYRPVQLSTWRLEGQMRESVQNIQLSSPLWLLCAHTCSSPHLRLPHDSTSGKTVQPSLLHRKRGHLSPKWVTTKSPYLVNGLSYLLEMQTEVLICYLGFALKYSGSRKMGGRDEARLAKVLIIIETGVWLCSSWLFFSIFLSSLKISTGRN